MTTLNEATAIEPARVLILTETDQLDLLNALDEGPGARSLLRNCLAHGDGYANEADELTRITLRKRRLQEEERRINRRIADLEPVIVEQMTELGVNRLGHEATGATLRLNPKAWIRYTREDLSTAEKAAVKAQAAAVMVELGGEIADLVKPDYNGNTVSAYFREHYLTALQAERDKPEHERRPVDPDALLPAELREYLRLDAQPHIEVRA